MKQFIDLAENIKDEELRKKVVDIIKNPTLSHKEFKKYPKADLEKARTLFNVGGMGPVERDVLNHTIAVTELCIKTAEIIEKNYGLKINKDYLIAGALLHDIMKIFEWKITKEGPEHTGVLLDHSFLGVAELYHRGFPEGVIHIVASHFGEHGPTPPRNFEALIFHYLDTLLSLTEYHHNAMHKQKQQIPMVLLDEETLKKIAEKAMKEEKDEDK